MMRKPLPGPEHESAEFRKSPAYREMCEALALVGVASYRALLEAPAEVRDRFHDAWTEAMCVRAGIVRRAPKPHVGRGKPAMNATRHRLLALLPATPDAALTYTALARLARTGETTVRDAPRVFEREGLVAIEEDRRVGRGRGQRTFRRYYRAATPHHQAA